MVSNGSSNSKLDWMSHFKTNASDLNATENNCGPFMLVHPSITIISIIAIILNVTIIVVIVRDRRQNKFTKAKPKRHQFSNFSLAFGSPIPTLTSAQEDVCYLNHNLSRVWAKHCAKKWCLSQTPCFFVINQSQNWNLVIVKLGGFSFLCNIFCEQRAVYYKWFLSWPSSFLFCAALLLVWA